MVSHARARMPPMHNIQQSMLVHKHTANTVDTHARECYVNTQLQVCINTFVGGHSAFSRRLLTNAVLKAHGHESTDGEPDAQQLGGDVLCSIALPDCHADQPVTKDTLGEGGTKAVADLLVGKLYCEALTVLEHITRHHKAHHQQAPCK